MRAYAVFLLPQVHEGGPGSCPHLPAQRLRIRALHPGPFRARQGRCAKPPGCRWTVAPATTSCAATSQPDALVGTRVSTRFIGDNPCNTTGTGKTKAATAQRGHTRAFYARVA